MFYTSISWYLLLLASCAGSFLYNFGEISLGNRRELIRSIGGILFYSSMVVSFFTHGWKGGITLTAISLIMTVPIARLARFVFLKLYESLSARRQ